MLGTYLSSMKFERDSDIFIGVENNPYLFGNPLKIQEEHSLMENKQKFNELLIKFVSDNQV